MRETVIDHPARHSMETLPTREGEEVPGQLPAEEWAKIASGLNSAVGVRILSYGPHDDQMKSFDDA